MYILYPKNTASGISTAQNFRFSRSQMLRGTVLPPFATLLRGISLPYPPGLPRGAVLRRKMPPNPPGMPRGTVLRGKMPPNPPELLRVTVLRRNEVSFSARNGKL